MFLGGSLRVTDSTSFGGGSNSVRLFSNLHLCISSSLRCLQGVRVLAVFRQHIRRERIERRQSNPFGLHVCINTVSPIIG